MLGVEALAGVEVFSAVGEGVGCYVQNGHDVCPLLGVRRGQGGDVW